MLLEGEEEVDRDEIGHIRRDAPELTHLCNLQPDNLSAQVHSLNQGIAAMLAALPP